jgi:hypothetical protein
MKKATILALAIIFLSLSGKAQNPKQKNFYKVPAPVISNEFKISFKDIVSKMDYLKMAVVTQNLLDDSYIMYKQEESKFIFPFGEYQPKPKTVFIAPKKERKKTMKVDGDTRFLVDSFTIHLDGIYKLPVKGNSVRIEKFVIPAQKNSITARNFDIKLIKQKKTTKETYLLFECKYNGDKIAIIDPAKISVKVDGKNIEYANDDKRAKPRFLQKGESAKFKAVFHIPGKIADMQFATMFLIWNDSFMEIKPEKLHAVDINFVLDLGMTHAKN